MFLKDPRLNILDKEESKFTSVGKCAWPFIILRISTKKKLISRQKPGEC